MNKPLYAVSSGKDKNVEEAIRLLVENMNEYLNDGFQAIGGMTVIYDKADGSYLATQAIILLGSK